jgi:hypothetical protein
MAVHSLTIRFHKIYVRILFNCVHLISNNLNIFFKKVT